MAATSLPMPARVGVFRAGESANLEFSGPSIASGCWRAWNAEDWSSLECIPQWVSRQVARVLDDHTSLRLTEVERDHALERLRSIGQTLISRILGRYRGTMVCLGPGSLGYGENDSPYLDVEVTCPDQFVLPAELLPVLEPQAFGSSVANDLRVAAGMLGFGASCHRPTRLLVPSNDGRLDATTMAYYWHADLGGAHDQLRHLKGRIHTSGPHPAKREPVASVLDRMVTVAGTMGSDRGSPAIEHFHCHHERRADEAADDVLRLKRASWGLGWFVPEVRVSAGALAERQYGQPGRRGLVFLNACGSQFVAPSAVGAVARELLRGGRDAVVTTWAEVTDDLAVATSKRFYEAFLRGENVGVALREARIRLLLEHNNPLGLLYTIYGNSRFSLRDCN